MVTNCFNGIFTKTENNTEMNFHLTLSINSLKKKISKNFSKNFLLKYFVPVPKRIIAKFWTGVQAD